MAEVSPEPPKRDVEHDEHEKQVGDKLADDSRMKWTPTTVLAAISLMGVYISKSVAVH